MRTECKRHDWRVGASKGIVVNKNIVKEGIWIWCFKCNKKIFAKNSEQKLNLNFKPRK